MVDLLDWELSELGRVQVGPTQEAPFMEHTPRLQMEYPCPIL